MNTLVLVVSNSLDATADYLCSRMIGASVPFLRFDSDADIEKLFVEYHRGRHILTVDGASITPDNVGCVWLRRPEQINLDNSEASEPERRHMVEEWTAAIEGFLGHIPNQKWLNHPSSNAAASYKSEQMSRARTTGLCVPDTLITRRPDAVREFWEHCQGQVIVKPLVSGYIEREPVCNDTQIFTSQVQQGHLENLDSTLPLCPALFQRRIKKHLDVRITVVDRQITAVGLEARDGGDQRLDIRRNDMNDVAYVPVGMPAEVERRLLILLESYGLRFAAVDMAIDMEDRWIFFEVNPNGQWAWTDLAGVTSISENFLRSFRRQT